MLSILQTTENKFYLILILAIFQPAVAFSNDSHFEVTLEPF